MITIGVDVGSTSVKAVLYDAVAEQPLQIASALLASRVEGTPPGYFEEDPAALAATVESVLAEVARPDVEAICFTGQMHGGLLTDGHGRPLTQLVTWQDRRGRRLARRFRKELPAETWEGLGTTVHSGFLGVTARWMIDEKLVEPRGWKLQGLFEWAASDILGIDPYTDPSGGAAWGLYDVRRGSWNEAALEACGVAHEALPRLVASGQMVGTIGDATARRLGLGAGVRVVSGTGDTQASYLGAGCRPDELLVNFGTGSQLLWASSQFVQWPGGDVRVLPGDRYVVSVSALAGGGAYARLADFLIDVARGVCGVELSRDDVYPRMNAAAGHARSGSDGVTFAPLFNGSRRHGESLRATLGGLDGSNFTLATVSRAMLEGMVDELALPYFEIPPDARPHRGIVGSGNGMKRNPVLQQIAAQRLGLPLRLSDHDEEAAIGAARLAAGMTR